jgi:hypothetical protein
MHQATQLISALIFALEPSAGEPLEYLQVARVACLPNRPGIVACDALGALLVVNRHEPEPGLTQLLDRTTRFGKSGHTLHAKMC